MAYHRSTAAEAAVIARDFSAKALAPERAGFTDVRDFCDLATGSDLTAHQLDRLSEMVLRRLPA